MRILIITYQGDVSGATNSLIYLSKGLAKKGHQIYVGCRKESLLFKNLQGSEVQVLPIEFRRKFDYKNIRQLRKIIIQYQIEIINAQSSWDRYSSILVRWCYRLKVKVVHTRRQTPMSMGGFFQNFLYIHGTDKIIAVSKGVKNDLEKLGIPSSHIKVIHNGTPKGKYEFLDQNFIKKLKEKFDINSEDFVIGCVSRLKKQVQILQALNQIKRNVKVIFVGIENNPDFQEIISKYPSDHKIFFEGNIPDTVVLNYFKIFDTHILASTMEGLSQSMLEAMALEVPVIATAAAGNLDLVKDGENGLLFEDGNIEQLAENINLLMSNQQIRNSLSEKAKRTALEEFSIDRTIEKYEDFFNELLNEK
ncbi:glycosyltransferase family 4 protein [soil metagenome]